MEPIIPNKSTRCGSVEGSNCVTYNGNSIPCINICNGDTVSDVLLKIGQETCYIQGLLNLSTLNLSCIYTPCPSCQNPTNLNDVLQIIVNAICTANQNITALQNTVNQLVAGTSLETN